MIFRILRGFGNKYSGNQKRLSNDVDEFVKKFRSSLSNVKSSTTTTLKILNQHAASDFSLIEDRLFFSKKDPQRSEGHRFKRP